MLNAAHAIGWKAKNFALQAVDGRTYSLADIRGPKGTLVVFICNHCPYVKASIDRIDARLMRYVRSASGRSPLCRTIPRAIPRTPSTT